jgi:peptidoglycan-associated lipoprotein
VCAVIEAWRNGGESLVHEQTREHLGRYAVIGMKGEVLMRFAVVGCVIAVLVMGCSKKQVKVSAPTPVPTSAAAEEAVKQEPVSPNVAVSDDLRKQCELHFNKIDQAPKFSYNEFELLEQDRTVLQQVADCVTSGPLKGRRLELVGRADPRGTSEYNLGLGDRRARTVSDYLVRLGVTASLIAPSTRGDLDARGTDETSWRTDRRVDLRLAN